MEPCSQPKTQTWCKLWIIPAWCKLSIYVVSSLLPLSGCIKSVCEHTEHQTCCNLMLADLLQVDETTCIKPACSSQLAASLLITCNRVVIIKPKQAMRTHPDIGLVIADVLQLARFWLSIQLYHWQQYCTYIWKIYHYFLYLLNHQLRDRWHPKKCGKNFVYTRVRSSVNF